MHYDLFINDTIGWPITADLVRRTLQKRAAQPVAVYINSFGGDVPTALDIYQQFREHGQVTAYVYGMTASAATVIACGAREVRMSRHALYLIHQSSGWVDTWGHMNADEVAAAIRSLSAQQDTLTKIDAILAGIYAERSGLEAGEFRERMGDALWLPAATVKALGLCDAILEEADEDHPADLEAAARQARLTACGLPPLPAAAADVSAPADTPADDEADEAGATAGPATDDTDDDPPATFADRVRAALARLGLACGPAGGAAATTTATPTHYDMNKETHPHLASIEALAAVEASADGRAHLTAAQLAAIEQELAALHDKLTTASAERDALAGADAAGTSHVEHGADASSGDDNDNATGTAPVTARAMAKKLAGVL